eukprot:Skav215834  [mRNA]  locus=scaffold4670:33294:38915:- [translate_table: standard]
MGCWCSAPEKDPEEENVTTADQPKQFGPAPNRSCTDVWCLVVLAVCWVCYFVVSFMGLADGNLARLYQPRDFMGSYCDVAAPWSTPSTVERWR